MSDNATAPPPSAPAIRLSAGNTIDGWDIQSREERIKYLQAHYLPDDPSVSLFECYSRGKKIVAWTEFVQMVLEAIHIHGNLTTTASDRMVRLFSALVNAFNSGLRKFSNLIAEGSNYILNKGGLSEDAVTQELEHLPIIKDLPISAGSKLGSQEPTHYLSLALNFFEDLLAEVKKWDDIDLRFGVPISSLIVTFVQVGKDFLPVYHSDINSELAE
ncbi:hypothetical protein AB5N19_03543 [Seiridium cardinale]|uniref:Uncharacterized protein n=1 Tax=Seiridium cardinale TaxID=138064 RepID=A0ABR2Y2M3_9PEZI